MKARIFLLLLLSFVGFSGGSLWASDLQDVLNRGKIVAIGFPHQESQFIRPDLDALRAFGGPLAKLRDGSAYRGIDIEILQAVAERLGVALEVSTILTSYVDLIPALLRGEGHVLVSGLTITEEREKVLDFSAPYLEGWIVVGASPGNDIKSVEHLHGLRAAVMRGSSHHEFLLGRDIPDFELVLTDYIIENNVLLEDGKVDVALFDSWAEVGQPIRGRTTSIEVALRLQAFDYGLAVRPDSDLLAPMAEVIEELRQSGEMRRILARHEH